MDCSTKSQFFISNNVIPSKENGDMFDIKPLLELLHVNNDVNVQVKLFSTLSAYIMTNEASKDKIITYNFLYDKMCAMLNNSSPRKTTVTLNFLSALLYVSEEDSSRRKSLIVYAKNMIRSSGCLVTMCDLFTSCMMHQDVWRSLCRCLAETCHGVEQNQSYCTHLVPMCIQRCSHRNIEVFSVLQSLLQNHTRNINLFIECNGISLFQRDYLQHHDCLQLLSILVQSSTEAVRAISESGISQTMRDFLRTYGPDSQLGQWATIILYYLSEGKEKGGLEVITTGNEAVNNKSIEDNEIINKTEGPDNLQCSTDTTKLLQNVMTELMQCDPSELKYLQDLLPAQPVTSQINNIHIQQNCIQNKQHDTIKTAKQNMSLKYNCLQPCPDMTVLKPRESLQLNRTKNSTFSCIELQNHKKNSNVTSHYTAEKYSDCLQKTMYTNRINSISRPDNTASLFVNARHNTPDIPEFKPKFASTPKQNNLNEDRNVNIEPSMFIHNSSRKSIRHSIRKREIKRRVEKKRIPRHHQQSKIDKENKHHRSISGWFFETINESCTTLVKTVKNIFRPKTSLEETKSKSLSQISDNNSSSCSFSFTNYMRRRDAILEKECAKRSRVGLDDTTMEWSNSCNTCNDTVALKRKLANDEYLKQTLRKLKLGINLYGCDFKKISRQLWPQQTYMTPVVLYNLYRKLILK